MAKKAPKGSTRRTRRTLRAGLVTRLDDSAKSGAFRVAVPRRSSSAISAAKPSPDFVAAMARMSALPPNFYDWLDDAPPWPADTPEIIGPLDT